MDSSFSHEVDNPHGNCHHPSCQKNGYGEAAAPRSSSLLQKRLSDHVVASYVGVDEEKN